jgi:hypothetical protein
VGASQFTGHVGKYGNRNIGYGGGAIYAEGPVVVAINNSEFSYCTGQIGGAVYGLYPS